MAIVRYLVNDVDSALGFYEILGFTLVQRWGPPFAILQHNDLQLWLSGPETSAARPMPDGSTPRPGGWNRLVVITNDLAALQRELAESGATFRNEPLTGPGGTQLLVEDPSGNPVELFQPAE